jgi:hypothetical protein
MVVRAERFCGVRCTRKSNQQRRLTIFLKTGGGWVAEQFKGVKGTRSAPRPHLSASPHSGTRTRSADSRSGRRALGAHQVHPKSIAPYGNARMPSSAPEKPAGDSLARGRWWTHRVVSRGSGHWATFEEPATRGLLVRRSAVVWTKLRENPERTPGQLEDPQ